MTRLIRNWQELAEVPANDKYRIIVDLKLFRGWIVPIWDEPSVVDDSFDCYCEKGMSHKKYAKHHVYLNTHTFYGSNYKSSTAILQKYGFDIKIDNWDKEDK